MRPDGARELRDNEESWGRAEPRALRLVDAPGRERTADAAERRVSELRPAEVTERRPPRPERGSHSERRTVQITGQAAQPRRRGSPAAARVSARPDRVALWALFLALFLAFMAIVTANAGAAGV